MQTSIAILWLAAQLLMPCSGGITAAAAAFSTSPIIPSPHHDVVSKIVGGASRQTTLWSSRDNDYYGGGSLFGNSDYYNGGGGGGSGSEDFRQVPRGERFRRRDNLRYGRQPGRYDEEFRMGGGGGERMQDYYNTPGQRGDMWQQTDNQYGGWQQQYDTSRGNTRAGSSNDFRRGSSAIARIQDFFTPRQREIRQRNDNDGARYGWQQQYNTDRGNVRAGSSNDFRRGSAYPRMQDYATPKQREIWQRNDNQGARYGWQQQYDTSRGNVREGSSSDFRRGSSRDRYQDFSTPRERERRQMRDNRELSRRDVGSADWGGSYGGRDDGVYGYGRDDDYYYDSGGRRGYSNDGNNSRGNSGARRQGSWGR